LGRGRRREFVPEKQESKKGNRSGRQVKPAGPQMQEAYCTERVRETVTTGKEFFVDEPCGKLYARPSDISIGSTTSNFKLGRAVLIP